MAAPLTSHEPREAPAVTSTPAFWAELDRLFAHLQANTLTPEVIPAPAVRTEISDALDRFERECHVGDDAARATLRLLRFYHCDNRETLRRTFAQALLMEPLAVEAYRTQVLLAILDPTSTVASGETVTVQ